MEKINEDKKRNKCKWRIGEHICNMPCTIDAYCDEAMYETCPDYKENREEGS